MPLGTAGDPPSTYLVRVLEGDLETQNPQYEQLALHDAVPELPKARVQFQGLAVRVEVPVQGNSTADGRSGWPQEPPVVGYPEATPGPLCC